MVVVSTYGTATWRTSVSTSGRRYSPCRRSGFFSRFDPRSSTKDVRAGGGCTSRARIQSLSARAGSGEAAYSGAAIACRSTTRPRVFIADGSRVMCLPEVVEIEPVVRRAPRMMLQPRRVSLHEAGEGLGAFMARQGKPVAERFEDQLVAVAAPVQAEGQRDGYVQDAGDQPWRGGEAHRVAEEFRADRGLVRDRAIGQHRHQRALVERFLHRQHDRRT